MSDVKAKTYHLAKLIANDGTGRVSPLCAKRPKALNNTTDTWTNRKEAVTCLTCLAIIAATPKPSEDEAAKQGGSDELVD